MAKIQPKQVFKILTGPIKITGTSVLSGNSSIVVTAAITSALTVAGDGSTSVPLQVSTSTQVPGVIVAAPHNKTDLWDNTSKDKILSSTNREVFARLTNSGSVYTLSFYYLNSSGVETAYTFTANTSIDFDFLYRFEFHQAPADIIVAQLSRNVAQDANGAGSIQRIEILTVTGTNSITPLTTTPTSATAVKLIVNGKVEEAVGSSPSFTMSGGVNITWNSANAGYSLDTTDEVVAEYPI